ncbi:hypothetical protein [Lacticaseibacillus zhaodongensis]|uniref:hypothetical protein n=1 Tax=Lacticaseibacillus zhaodongensis TaxID=2668065 RepID=UPI0012D34A6E|nr:hypothetical protein [Lacticaseibacillus zhaodongensis]
MNVFTALQMIQIDHQELNPNIVFVTDEEGKPDNVLSGLVHDVLTNVAIFADLHTARDAEDLIDQLHANTPLPDDVLDEYRKILEQEIAGINFSAHKQVVELIYRPLL